MMPVYFYFCLCFVGVSYLPRAAMLLLNWIINEYVPSADKFLNSVIRKSAILAVNHALPVDFFNILEADGFRPPDFERVGLPLNHWGSFLEHVTGSVIIQESIRNLAHFMGNAPSEAKLRVLLWDPIITYFFGNPVGLERIFKLEPEWNSKDIFKQDAEKRVDYALLAADLNMPIVLIEIGKSGQVHLPKDFSKLTTMMSFACKSLCMKFFALNLDMTLARIFGIWISGTEVRLCVAHPVITMKDGFSHISVSISFHTHWNIDLLKGDSTGICQDECCFNIHSCEKIILLPGNDDRLVVENVEVLPADAGFHFDDDFIVDEDEDEVENDLFDGTNANLQLQEQNDNNLFEEEGNGNEHATDLENVFGRVNYSVLCRMNLFITCAKQSYIKAIESGTNLNQPPPHQNPDKPIFPKSVPSEQHTTPGKSRIHIPNLNPVKFKLQRFSKEPGANFEYTDHLGAEHYVICKSVSFEYEFYLKTFGHILFPFAYSLDLNEDGTVVMYDFEKMSKITEIPLSELDFVRGGCIEHLLIEAVTFALHSLCGLWILHNLLNCVHGDISPSNVLFSPRDGVWKLNDFNRSLPIEISLQERRVSGTAGFIAPESLATGIFTPQSDVFSLGMTIRTVFSIPILVQTESDDEDSDSEGVGEEATPSSLALYYEFEDLTMKLIRKDSKDRISVEEAIKQLNHFLNSRLLKKHPQFPIYGVATVFPLVKRIVNGQMA